MNTETPAIDCEECVVPNARSKAATDTELECVTCPFCKQTVNALITPETIECPKCKVVVTR